jgi:hypothetical protein
LVICAPCTVSARGAVCVRLPEVPVNVTVDVEDAAVTAAVSVTVCAIPGARLNVAGLAVTPAGSPVIAMFTVPVNEFTAVAVTLTKPLAPPAASVAEVGASVSVKSGGGAPCTVSARGAMCVRLPDVPVNVSVDVEDAAVLAAVSVTVCAIPGERLNVAGLAVTPAGSPVIAMFTVPVNEFTAFAVTLTKLLAPPAASVAEVGARVSVKSGGGAEIVAVTVAAWLNEPDVPVKVNVALPTAAFALALTVTFWEVPGFSVRVPGLTVMPAGAPVIATTTAPPNPLTGATLTLIVWLAPPGMSPIVAGVEVKLKSPGGELPPHATNIRQSRKPAHPTSAFG